VTRSEAAAWPIRTRSASVASEGKEVHLTPTEYRLLLALITCAGDVVSRETLSQRVWGFADPSAKHLVDVHVARLRAKLRCAGGQAPLVTVRGRGFQWSADVDGSQI